MVTELLIGFAIVVLFGAWFKHAFSRMDRAYKIRRRFLTFITDQCDYIREDWSKNVDALLRSARTEKDLDVIKQTINRYKKVCEMAFKLNVRLLDKQPSFWYLALFKKIDVNDIKTVIPKYYKYDENTLTLTFSDMPDGVKVSE